MSDYVARVAAAYQATAVARADELHSLRQECRRLTNAAGALRVQRDEARRERDELRDELARIRGAR